MTHQSQRGVGLVETAGVDEPDALIGCKLASGFIRHGAKYRSRALSGLGRRDEPHLVRHQPSTAVDVGARVLTSSEPGEELRQARFDTDLVSRSQHATGRIRFNSLNPGATRTYMRLQAYPAEDRSRLVEPAAVVAPFLYLLGPDSRGVSGQAFDCQR